MVLLPAPTGPSIAITREDRERGASRPAPIRPPDRSPSDSNIVRHLAEPAVGRQNGEQARKTGKRSLHARHISDRRLTSANSAAMARLMAIRWSPDWRPRHPQTPPALDTQAGPRHGDGRPSRPSSSCTAASRSTSLTRSSPALRSPSPLGQGGRTASTGISSIRRGFAPRRSAPPQARTRDRKIRDRLAALFP